MQYTAETIVSCIMKEIVKGESYVMLSQEEVEALRKAVNFELGEMSEDEKEFRKNKEEQKK